MPEGLGSVEGRSARLDDFPSPVLPQEVAVRVESDQTVAVCVTSMGDVSWVGWANPTQEQELLTKMQTSFACIVSKSAEKPRELDYDENVVHCILQ